MIGAELKALRLELKISRASLGTLLKYSPKTIYQWETGRRRIPGIVVVTLRLMPTAVARPYRKPCYRRRLLRRAP